MPEKIRTILSVATPFTTLSQLAEICEKATNEGYIGIAIPPIFIKKAKEFLTGTNLSVSALIGFPYGYSAVESKVAEIVLALIDQADEIDVVINPIALKNNDWQYLANELNAIMQVVNAKRKTIKILLDAVNFDGEELIKCCDFYGIAGVDYLVVNNCNTDIPQAVEVVKIIRKHLADSVRIAAGSYLETQLAAEKLIEAGADVILTSNSNLQADC